MTLQRKIDSLTKRELQVYWKFAKGGRQPPSASDREALSAALKERVGGDVVTPLDINLATPEMLASAGLDDSAVTALRERRPILQWNDLDHLPDLTPAKKKMLESLFNIPTIRLPDGKTLKASTNAAPIIAESSQVESRIGAADVHYRMPGETEEFETLADERQLPAYEDESGVIRYLDPRYITAQMRKSSDDPAVAALLTTAGVQIFRRFQTPGLLMLVLESSRHGPAALNTALAVLAASPLTDIVEPAWIATDKMEGASRSKSKLLQRPASSIKIRERIGAEGATDSHGGSPRECGASHVEAEVAPAGALESEAGGSAMSWNIAMMSPAALGRGNPAITLVAVDTGVDPAHPAIAGRIVPRGPGEIRNYEVGVGADPMDDDGHGTAVASILVGSDAGGVRGMAPACSLIVLKVPLFGTLTAYALRRDALLSLATRATGGQKLVVNLSWRTSGDVALVRDAVERLTSAGAIVVCSGGNGDAVMGQPHYPSDYPSCISVAALASTGQRAAYSYFGNAIDLAAPGGDANQPILCAQPGGGTTTKYGTSFAAPHVAGAVALFWSRALSMNATQVRNAVESAAVPLAEPGLGRGLPRLTELAAALPPDPLAADDDPPPAPSASDIGNTEAFPVPGARLADLNCVMPVITRRILRGRQRISGWGEAAAILGMPPQSIDCMRSKSTLRD